MSSAAARTVALLAVVVALITGGASPAAADPVGPTDYRTEIVAVEPATPEVELAILGGDSFVELAAAPGTEVRVTGYRGEPYLWFDGDGVVRQNERSPSRWLNDDRFGEAEIPPIADKDAEPDWIEVASDGVYAWHDHRAHWMNPDRPIGAEPGDVILEAVIPLDVNGSPVAVEVRSELLASPSPLGSIGGAVAALVGGAPLLIGWRRRVAASDGELGRNDAAGPLGVVAFVAAVALLSTVVGVAATLGLPGEAAPGPVQWLLPLVAGVASLLALVLVVTNRVAGPLRLLLVQMALVLAGMELLLWSWLRREALFRALIPTEAPEWLDRFVVAGAAATGLVALIAAAATVTERRLAPRPTR